MKIFTWKKKKSPPEAASPEVTWKDLMTSKGLALWRVRDQAVKDKEKEPFVELPLRKRGLLERSQPPSVAVIKCPHFFAALEKEQDALYLSKSGSADKDELHGTNYHGLDKSQDLTPASPRPLTRCTGNEWIRQRQQVTSAFQHLPARSLEAVRSIDIDRIFLVATCGGRHHEDASCILDWKYVAQHVALRWVVRLFGGPLKSSSRPADVSHYQRRQGQIQFERNLEDALLEYWKCIRSEKPLPHDVISKRRSHVIASLTTDGGGVLDALFDSGLSKQEAHDNALNAMVAAFDAAQSLLFWTIVNLAKRKNSWEEGHRCAVDKGIYQKDLEGLAKFKHGATKGEIVDYSGLSYLGRALCETVRVYPPVWTLPRTWPMESGLVDLSKHNSIQWSKVDVPSINGAKNPQQDWNPDCVKPSHIASFGLGRRHCPAGTGALYAVYHALTEVLKRVERMEPERQRCPEETVRLLPTLCIGTPYWPFYKVKLSEEAAETLQKIEAGILENEGAAKEYARSRKTTSKN